LAIVQFRSVGGIPKLAGIDAASITINPLPRT
jgi:hypothetical protein